MVFNIVNNCKSDDYLEGISQQAWKLLDQKFQANTALNYIKITKLESLRFKMDNLCINPKIKKMEDNNLIIHILSNLPEDYKMEVNNLENSLSDPNPD